MRNDTGQYFLRLRDERGAQSRLDDILGSETRNGGRGTVR